MRLAMVSILTTMAIGGTMGFAVAHRTDGEGLASTAQPMDEQPLAGVSAAGVDGTRVHQNCKADAARYLATLFLNPICESNKVHARHGARAANRVATVILGRVDAAPIAGAPAPVAATAIEPSQANVGSAEKSANTTTAALERTTPPKKPKAKASAPVALTPPARELSRQNAMVNAATFNAYAPTARFGRESYDPHGNTFRATALQSGFDARFGRSW